MHIPERYSRPSVRFCISYEIDEEMIEKLLEAINGMRVAIAYMKLGIASKMLLPSDCRERGIAMSGQISVEPLSRSLKPVCPRDVHEMRYEERGIHWKEIEEKDSCVASYHCGYFGCSIRYNNEEGYFTVVDTPDIATYVEEPGVNQLLCARHHTWMCYVKSDGTKTGFMWRCGVDGCDQTHADIEHLWLKQPEL